jgi:hypothetical protein
MSHLVAKYGSHLCAPQKSKIRSVHFYILKKLPPALAQAGDESLCDFASLVSEIRPNITAPLKNGLFNLIHPEMTGGEIANQPTRASA